MEKREYSLRKIFENQILNDLYDVRGDGFECVYFKMYGKPKAVIKSEECRNEMMNFINETIKDKEIQQQLLDKFNSCRDYSLEEMTLWDRQYYKLGFLDGMYLKNKLQKSQEKLSNKPIYNSKKDSFFNECRDSIIDFVNHKQYGKWKEREDYKSICNKIFEIKEKYPNVRHFIDEDVITELSQKELKAVSEIINLSKKCERIELVETFKLGLKEGWSI